eukprot:Sspe_Gene.27996::Locus_12429_Transcript_1_1_Confidence_1.000_Length_2491::g.27996::m.27996
MGNNRRSLSSVGSKRGRVLNTLASAVVTPNLSGTESPEELLRKKVLIPALYLCMLYLLLLVLVSRLLSEPMQYTVVYAIQLALGMCFAIFIYITKSLTVSQASVIIFVMSLFAVLVSDNMHRGSFEGWVSAVIAMKCFLVAQADRWCTQAFGCLTVLYLVLASIERVSSFGFYVFNAKESPGVCDKLSVLGAVLRVFFKIFVFLLDFYLTKWFANGMHDEQQATVRSIAIARNIAEAFVRFDLDKAEAELHKYDTPLHEAFASLLTNLHEYRPYLPDALFGELDRDKRTYPLRAPPGERGTVTVVFTDIQASTALWENQPKVMRQALEVHNNIIREQTDIHDGYEVKTIGDAFMLVFDHSVSACSFSLATQEALFGAVWPDELLENPICAPSLVWNGLRVRIGIHTGEVDMQINPITRRADYFGPTVNKASRVTGCAEGGQIFVTSEVMSHLRSANLPLLEYDFCSMGVHVLKGVETAAELFCILPTHLSSRMHIVDTVDSLILDAAPSPTASSAGSVVTNRIGFAPTMTLAMSCTVGNLRINVLSKHIKDAAAAASETVGVVVDRVERTEGVVGSAFGSNIIISWNTNRRCDSHVLLSARFGTLLLNSRDTRMAGTVLGLATGPAMYGSIGSANQRFFTAVGWCVECTAALCLEAEALNVAILTAALPGHKGHHHEPFDMFVTRPLDVWCFPDGECEVHQLTPNSIDCFLRNDVPEEKSWAWSPEYVSAFRAREWQTILSKCDGDEVVFRAVSYHMKGERILSLPLAGTTPRPAAECR